MNEPRWLQRGLLLALHDRLVAEFGGASGIRDIGRLDAAVDRPRQAFGYGMSDLADLAASYAAALVLGHPFIDGNKRIGFVAAATFLELNGQRFGASEAEAVVSTLGLAAGDVSEKEYADWLRRSCSE